MANNPILSDRQMVFFCRSLSLQLHAGISLAEGIYLMAEDEDRQLRNIFLKIGASLDRGEQLDTAMKEAGCFPAYACAMVAVGQRTGRLEQTLAALAEFYDRRHQQKRQVKNALTYPCMVFVLMLIVVAVLLMKVLPVFEGVYGSLGSRLTGVAAWLLGLGIGLKQVLPALLGILVVGVGFGLLYGKVPVVRSRFGNWYRGWFGDRGIGRKFNNARFAQSLAMGLSGGLTLEESVTLAEELLHEVPGAARRCRICALSLENGDNLVDAMTAAAFLPPAESRMLAVGLRGGNGDRVMEEIARRLSSQAEEALEDAVAGIEPALVLIASGLVGVILLSVMLPLMNIMAAIG